MEQSLYNDLLYLRLEPKEQELFEDANLTGGHAKILLQIDDENMRTLVLTSIIENHLTVPQSIKFVENFSSSHIGQISKSSLPKDIRLYLNTIDKTVSRMKAAGIECEVTKNESADYFECIIRIPKKSL